MGSAGCHLALRNDLRVQQAGEGFPKLQFLRPTGKIKLLCVRLPHGTAQVGLFWHAGNEILWADGFDFFNNYGRHFVLCFCSYTGFTAGASGNCHPEVSICRKSRKWYKIRSFAVAPS
uniref:(northern house mosquito) hypothetical protein n=1 Tax=Culex pipiens TaxID=7175 RepID=A0A8D8L422_CULPI